MGAESYLLSVVFKEPIPQNEIKELLVNCGADFLSEISNLEPQTTFRNYFFEIKSDLGLTELNVLLTPNENFVNYFTIRFSILSPSSVIDQSLEFLRRVKNKRLIKVFAPESDSKEIELDTQKFKLNKRKNRILETILSNKYSLIIEGGDITTQYIFKHNLVDEVWGMRNEKRSWWQRLMNS